MEKIIDFVGNGGEGRGRGDGVTGDAVATRGHFGNEGEIGGADKGGVALELHQLPRANQNGSEFQYSVSLSRSGWDRRLQVEEGDSVALFIHGRRHC